MYLEALETNNYAATDYAEEMKSLLAKENDRAERILRRIDECLAAIERSKKILKGD
jgi:hypothetical protein